MAKTVIKGAKLYLDGYDVSGDHNAVAFNYGAELKDSTAIGDLTHKREGGLKTFSAAHAGMWEGGTAKIDEILSSRVGLTNVVTTLCPTTGIEGEPAFFATVAEASYVPGAAIGELFGFSVQMESVSDLFRGTVLHNATRTATGTGTIMLLGPVSATQRVSAALHVVGPVTGTAPTLDVTIQSASTVGFGSPTFRANFFTASAIVGQQIAPVLGPITDPYWRAIWTIGGTGSPSFPFIVSLAIN